MKRILVGGALLAFAAVPLQAQSTGSAVTHGQSSFYVGPYVGYMDFGTFYETAGDIRFSNKNGPVYGAQAGVSFSPNVSLLGNFAYAPTKFVFKNYPTTGGGTETLNLNNVGVWLYDANLQFRVPFITSHVGSWIAPFVQLGGGAARYTTDENDIRSASKSRVAFNGGIGGDFQFLKVIGARVMVKDYVTSLQWDRAGDVTANSIKEKNLQHNLAYTFGINLGF